MQAFATDQLIAGSNRMARALQHRNRPAVRFTQSTMLCHEILHDITADMTDRMHKMYTTIAERQKHADIYMIFTMRCYAFTAVPKRRCRSRLRFTYHSITLSFWLKHENRSSSHGPCHRMYNTCNYRKMSQKLYYRIPYVLTPACFGPCVALWSANLELEIFCAKKGSIFI